MMAIRPPLNHKPQLPAAEPKASEPDPTPVPTPPEPKGRAGAYRSPSRVGKRAAVAWLEPEAVKQLNMVAIQRDIHVQDILVEAVNDWFARHGLPRFDA
jgi:hypothetical protein